MNNLRK